jgi:hypothetical protein
MGTYREDTAGLGAGGSGGLVPLGWGCSMVGTSVITKRRAMRAKVGDKIMVKGHHVAEPDRDGVVVEVRGADGTSPYVVKWSDGHESIYFPGSDASVMNRTGGVDPSANR